MSKRVEVQHEQEGLKVQVGSNASLPLISSEIKFKERIGNGNFGVVYKAQVEGKDIVVKEPSDSERKTYLVKEAELLHKFVHPNIVTCHGVDKENNLVMEYMDCGHVLGYIKNGNGDRDAHLAIALQLALGLQYLHKQGFIHIDVKSVNILINSNGEVKIGDFGSAVKAGTLTGTVLTGEVGGGTILYQPPEVFSSPEEKISFPYDIFSFGTFLGELFVKDHVKLKGSTMKAIIENNKENKLHRSLSIPELKIHGEANGETREATILEVLCSLYYSCREVKPEKRPSIDEVVEKLKYHCVEQLKIDIESTLKNAFSVYKSTSLAPKPLEIKLNNISTISLEDKKNNNINLPPQNLNPSDGELVNDSTFCTISQNKHFMPKRVKEILEETKHIVKENKKPDQATVCYPDNKRYVCNNVWAFFGNPLYEADRIIKNSSIQLAIIHKYLDMEGPTYESTHLKTYITILNQINKDLINSITAFSINHIESSTDIFKLCKKQLETVIYYHEELEKALKKAIAWENEREIQKPNDNYHSVKV